MGKTLTKREKMDSLLASLKSGDIDDVVMIYTRDKPSGMIDEVHIKLSRPLTLKG